MPEDHFGERIAARYDENHREQFDAAVVEPAVDFLAALAGSGPALEFGIGTGRIALPLSRRGVAVAGIDLSPSMVAMLRAKPGGAQCEVAIGDFATTRVEGSFALVYLLFNTIMNLTSADEQVECFQNAARHLRPGGCFVIEVGVPQLQRLPPGETVRAFALEEGHLGFDEYDIAVQRLVSHHYRFMDGGVTVDSVPFRYVWPAELDLMARIAGMSLHGRWGGWTGQSFTGQSTMHVSVWRIGTRAP